MAAHVNKYLHPITPVATEDVLCANGITAICSILSFALADENEGLLLMRPIYGKFENDFSILSRWADQSRRGATQALTFLQDEDAVCGIRRQ